jgi:hypothetical protein
MWHACGDHTVERFLAGKGPGARELFDRFESLVAACGPYEVAPAKTRVAFMARVRYASVNSLSDRGMSIHFGLPAPLDHARIRRVERIGDWFVHHVRITTPEQLDEELLGWLRTSYRQMGLQERLREGGSTRGSQRPNLT